MSRKALPRSSSAKSAPRAKSASGLSPDSAPAASALSRTPGKSRPLTLKQEAFAQQLALSRDAAAAYRASYGGAGMRDATLRSKASKMARDERIVARVAEHADVVSRVALERFEITTEKVLAEIAATAFANAADYYDWGVKEVPRMHRRTGEVIKDEAGNIVTDRVPFAYAKPAESLSRMQKAAIVGAEQSFSKTGDVVVSVKMANKLQALALLLQHTTKMAEKAPAAVQVNVVGGATQVVTDSASIAMMADPKAALQAFEAARARLMSPKKV